MIDVNAIVVMFIRAAASHYADSIRQYRLYGSKPGDSIHDNYRAAQLVRYPRRTRRR